NLVSLLAKPHPSQFSPSLYIFYLNDHSTEERLRYNQFLRLFAQFDLCSSLQSLSPDLDPCSKDPTIKMSNHASPRPAGPPEAEAKPDVNSENPVINIKVKDQMEAETFFKIKQKTKLGKVFDAYCDRNALQRTTVRFLLDGQRIQDTDTPDSLQMEDGDMVDAVLEQIGGAGIEVFKGHCETKPDAEVPVHINIKVKDQAGQEVLFKIKKSTLLKKVMSAFCERQEVDPKAVRFLYDGTRLQENDTPEGLEMEDQDCIEVFAEQLGGVAEDVAGLVHDLLTLAFQAEPRRLMIIVKDTHGETVQFRCKSTTLLDKLIKAFCDQRNRQPGTLKFYTQDGKRLTPGATPEALELEDGGIIDAFEEQLGGR
ncbi:ubiquitin-like modifier, partial [Diplocarpon rosae]